MSALEGRTGFEPRRADYVLSALLDSWGLTPSHLRTPKPVSYQDLARVHSPQYLESLGHARVLADIYAIDPSDLRVDELMRSVRLGVGGTLDAARHSLRHRCPSANLFGGFHHAGPSRGGGFCVLNDIAVAVATLRAEGFRGYVSVLDFDAHPPDGTAECLGQDDTIWIGSISGCDWGKMPGVDETVLPARSGDKAYLDSLEALLSRMPCASLAFVIAGGDVLAGDRMGGLGLTLDGARKRDFRVSQALANIPSVWLPDAWRILASAVLGLLTQKQVPIPDNYDPMRAKFTRISKSMGREALGPPNEFSLDDVADALGIRTRRNKLLFDYYTAQGIEFGFQRYGVLDHLRRLGFDCFRIDVEPASLGESVRLYARSEGKDLLLIECVLEKRKVAGFTVLYVHWLMLCNPRAQFSERRPKLPGQELPGLGLAREAGELFSLMAARLGLAGVAFRPAWYHTAYLARAHFRFVDSARQGRFEAMLRDFAEIPLLRATLALTEGRVRLNGQPYSWEADEMAYWITFCPTDAKAVAEHRDAVHFTLLEDSCDIDPMKRAL
jgi:acetoin utilization deacetylase AcuC-like enzyme